MAIDKQILDAYNEPPAVLCAPCDGDWWIVTRPVAHGAGGVLAGDDHRRQIAQLGLEGGAVVEYLQLLERNGLAPALSGGGGEGGTGEQNGEHGGRVAP